MIYKRLQIPEMRKCYQAVVSRKKNAAEAALKKFMFPAFI